MGTNFSRPEKLLATVFEMANGTKMDLKFEDIVVGVFKKFPDDFHLRGYKKYPDSGDLVHKPLYTFRKKGLMEVNHKVFSFTDRGLAYAEQIINLMAGKIIITSDRLTRSMQKEITRIQGTDGFNIFIKGDRYKINDTDFFNYLGVTPRTPKNDFMGRIHTMQEIVKEIKNQKNNDALRKKIIEYHDFLISEKFKNIVDHFKSN